MVVLALLKIETHSKTRISPAQLAFHQAQKGLHGNMHGIRWQCHGFELLESLTLAKYDQIADI